MPGKIDSPLNEKLKNIQWGEFRIRDLFVLKNSKNKLVGRDLDDCGDIPVYSANSTENGIVGYTNTPEFICSDSHPMYLIFGDHTRSFNIATCNFAVMDNVKVLYPVNIHSVNILLFIIATWKKLIPDLGYSRHWKVAKDKILKLPIKDGNIDFEFIESFVADLKALHLANLKAYFSISGLDNYDLTSDEKMALSNFGNVTWAKFNLKDLYGQSTRGKRLKSMDRINGELPFVTAGEANEGVSAFIGNKVDIFSKNTITIDMFGSAKFRNYKYGADDHIAVVHTETLSKFSAIFVTTAIHKSSYTGQFSYSRNFYAKDADELNIQLPVKDNNIDNHYMDVLISAIHKLVIKDVVLYVK